MEESVLELEELIFSEMTPEIPIPWSPVEYRSFLAWRTAWTD